MEDKGTNFALLTMVAIVAIIALVVLLKAQSQKAMPVMDDGNVAGQMMRIGEAHCNVADDGTCKGSCATGTSCKEIKGNCDCG